MKKMVVSTLILVAPLFVQANDLYLHCDTKESAEDCGKRVIVAMNRIGCQVDADTMSCKYTHDANTGARATPYCEVTSQNCSQPIPGLFGAENCSEGQKTELLKSDRVHNGYWFGPFGSYSRTICK